MLYHHDSRDYDTAAKTAATNWRQKYERLLADGPARAGRVVEYAQTHVPTDQVVPAAALKWITTPDGFEIGIPDGRPTRSIHRNALRQAAAEAEIPLTFVDRLLDTHAVVKDGKRVNLWAGELLAHNFTTLFARKQSRHLLRSVVNGRTEVRGFLSDKYRRLDSRPLIDAFAGAAQQIGAVPIDGEVTDTRIWIRAILPTIFEPVPNEPMVVGLRWQNSDFGAGAYVIEAFICRLWCTNFADTENCLRRVHLGTRLADNVSFSDETHQLDTATMVSATRDIIKGALSAEKVEQMTDAVKQAHARGIDAVAIPAYLKRLGLTQADSTEVVEAFASADIVNLPPGQSVWRLSNALSWVAQRKEPEKALELNALAGKVLLPKVA